MKKLLPIILFLMSTLAVADTCKVNLFEDKGWFPDEIKTAIEAKNYEFVSRNDYAESEIDFYISYVPQTVGIYPGAGRNSGSKRFVYFQVKKPRSRNPIIFTNKGSKKKKFSYLMKKLNKRALKLISKKLPVCDR